MRDARRNEIRKNNILFLLDQKGMTRTCLADLCDMKYSQLNKYIGNSASRLISDLVIERMEKAFGLNVDDLDEDITGNTESNSILDKVIAREPNKKKIEDVFLTIPLFLNIFVETFEMDENEESNVAECYLECDVVLNCGVNPKSIKALQYFNHDKTIPLAEKSVIYFDSSIRKLTKENGVYLVLLENTRTVLQLNSSNSFNAEIIGRVFFSKQFL